MVLAVVGHLAHPPNTRLQRREAGAQAQRVAAGHGGLRSLRPVCRAQRPWCWGIVPTAAPSTSANTTPDAMPFAPPALPSVADAPFVRLWRGILTGRAMVALALLVLQGLGLFINLVPGPAVLAVCGVTLQPPWPGTWQAAPPRRPRQGRNGSRSSEWIWLRCALCNCCKPAP